MRRKHVLKLRQGADEGTKENEGTAKGLSLTSSVKKKFKSGFSTPRPISSSNEASVTAEEAPKLCYKVEYYKGRKKKPIKSDAILIRQKDKFTLFEDNGSEKSTQRIPGIADLGYGSEFTMSSCNIEVSEKVDIEHFTTGQIFCAWNIKLSLDKLAQEPHVADPLSLYESKIDQRFLRVLRPHQREGVAFMLNCCTGNRVNKYHGSILADEMGLGKTLQAITVASTLMSDPSFQVNSTLVACPVSLVRNWAEEIHKWMDSDNVDVFHVLSGKSFKPNLKRFEESSKPKFFIMGYESIRSQSAILAKVSIGLIIADEGHRLKNSEGNQTIRALNKIQSNKRIILTGTPIQNNLDELYSICNFVNPNMLGSVDSFRNVYSGPISTSRDEKGSDQSKKLGTIRAQYLTRIISLFTIRRTADLLKNFLPPKREFILFCRMGEKQKEEYKELIASKEFEQATSKGQTASALICIRKLRELSLCKRSEENELQEESGKTVLLSHIISQVKQNKDKIVIVSNFRKTLDLANQISKKCNILTQRLDGSTDQSQRQTLVHAFNTSEYPIAFLLSAKAGGVGLNLIGANKIVLMEPEWNPSIDKQAVARIWRDGQTKQCSVYRLVSTLSIEEKIIQRQLTKEEVASLVADQESAVRHFDQRAMKDLFQL